MVETEKAVNNTVIYNSVTQWTLIYTEYKVAGLKLAHKFKTWSKKIPRKQNYQINLEITA